MMDPDRVRSYLQVACAGLGFDIGEVWWTSNSNGSSTVAAIKEKVDTRNGSQNGNREIRFVQLYTSKAFANRRSMLVGPPEDSDDESSDDESDMHHHGHHRPHTCTASDLEKHVLSPRLVEAISETAQVVWANTKKQEGLLGRSDLPLRTAVGMPVAVDDDGNMCIVVMFSPNDVQSTDDAMEYLQSISRFATSTQIPCLKPAFNLDGHSHLPHSVSDHNHHLVPYGHSLHADFGKDVTARFVSLQLSDEPNASPEVHVEHDLTAAPKDCFGIPMLPSFAELGNAVNMETPTIAADDIFDEASYGVWNTIMDVPERRVHQPVQSVPTQRDVSASSSGCYDFNLGNDCSLVDSDSDRGQIVIMNKPLLPPDRKERLADFTTAFLGMSVFDAADVWIPAGSNYPDSLAHDMSVSSPDASGLLNEFRWISERSMIRFWNGAVGRAYSSGNPVWSTNPEVFVDSERAAVFDKIKIRTVFAVPVFCGRHISPACVLCCYSLVRAGSVPFVLRFVQQALRLLWHGLDNVEPHESVGKRLWQEVGPADLGEMAADIEMQEHFMARKRPHLMPSVSNAENDRFRGNSEALENAAALCHQIVAIGGHFADFPRATQTAGQVTEQTAATRGTAPPQATSNMANTQIRLPPVEAVQNHVQEALRSVGGAVPLTSIAEESKPVPAKVDQQPSGAPLGVKKSKPAKNGQCPLMMPHALPTGIVTQRQSRHQQHARVEKPREVSPATNASHLTTHPPIFTSMPTIAPTIQPMTVAQPHMLDASNVAAHVPIIQNVPIPELGLANPASVIGGSGVIPQAPVIISAAPAMHVTSAQQCLPVGQPSAPVMSAGGKRCRIQGCDEPAVTRRPYCLRHSGNRLCEHPGCSKCAQGSTRFCIAHGGGRRCTFPGCDKGARDKFFCAAHGGGKRCVFEGCTKSAVGGSNLCTAHGGGRRCAVEGCDKSAQSSTKFCVKHGGGKKCSHVGCEKVARGRTLFCAAHGGGVRCKLEGCNRVAIGKLQLCRAHGGGTRRKPRKQSPPRNTLPTKTVPANPTNPVNPSMHFQEIMVDNLASI